MSQALSTSAILANQEQIFEQKIISKIDFDIMVQKYIDSFNDKFKKKAFINEETYKDIIKLLLLDNNNNLLYDSKLHSQVRNNFTLKLIGNDYIICKIPNNCTKEAMEKNKVKLHHYQF